MSAFNVVRFRVKPGRDQEFINAHRKATEEGFTGARRVALIKTGDNSYCVVGEWDSFDNIVAARPRMISLLDTFRDCLEDLGALGVTDPVSGETVFEKNVAAPKARRKAPAKRKAAPKRAKSSAKRKAAKPARKAKKAPARKAARKRR